MRIDPREPDVIQNLRRSMRSRGMAYNTETAYVKWVRRYVRDRDLTCQRDFAIVDEREIESFLTDLTVEGDVSDSTQNRAFFPLIGLFQHLLERPLMNSNAIRADAAKWRPALMSESGVASVLRSQHREMVVAARSRFHRLATVATSPPRNFHVTRVDGGP